MTKLIIILKSIRNAIFAVLFLIGVHLVTKRISYDECVAEEIQKMKDEYDKGELKTAIPLQYRDFLAAANNRCKGRE